MQEIIIPAVVSLIGVLLTALVAYVRILVNRFLVKMQASDAEKQAVDALVAGIAFAQEELVIFAKRAAEDGKLTTEERHAARDMAIEMAKKVATGPGLEVLKTASKERLDGWIKEILARWSKK